MPAIRLTRPTLHRSPSSSSSSLCSVLSSTSSTSTTSSKHSDRDGHQRKTRRRFTRAQVSLLEALYAESTHPSKEQRERVARKGDIDGRSVMIWMQNKRQIMRRAGLQSSSLPALTYDRSSSPSSDSPSSPMDMDDEPSPPQPPAPKLIYTTTVSAFSSKSQSKFHAQNDENLPPHGLAQPTLKKPTLDAIASHYERPPPRTPRTLPSPTDPLWAHMPSSPLSPFSPKDMNLTGMGMAMAMKRGRRERTLEWACSAARSRRSSASSLSSPGEDGEETEVEEDDTMKFRLSARSVSSDRTCFSSSSSSDHQAQARAKKVEVGEEKVEFVHVQDEEMMNAALMLIGLNPGRL